MPLVYAYRIIKGDRIVNTNTTVERRVELANGDIGIHFANGGYREFKPDRVLTITNSLGAPRPKYRDGQRARGW